MPTMKRDIRRSPDSFVFFANDRVSLNATRAFIPKSLDEIFGDKWPSLSQPHPGWSGCVVGANAC